MASGNPPQLASQFDIDHYYFFPRPQTPFGGDAGTPPPPVLDFEIIEEVASVFDNMIYNESGGGNDGQVVVTKI